ncbi:universal stress protein [Streptomyces massasporeus]|uniref:universal stress protein n=1 Tax=Streptomyces massasporeus TaxID=67324 RepID=UPI0037BA3090
MTGIGRRGTVLVGVDDTSHSWLAADWAAMEAELRGCPLKVVHAVGRDADSPHGGTGVGLTEQVLGAAMGVLEDARGRLRADRPGLSVDTDLARDDPAEALVSAAEGAEMVVVGSRGRGGFAGLLLGSVSQKVVAHADRPVVVVRERTGTAAGGGVVVGVRDKLDEAAVRFALAEAGLRRAGVRLIHAWRPTAHTSLAVPEGSGVEEERQAHARLLNIAARPIAEFPKIHVDTELIIGSPAAALVEASARAGLVVLPRHPAEGRLGLRLGTVVHAVLHHASCPVVVVPVR